MTVLNYIPYAMASKVTYIRLLLSFSFYSCAAASETLQITYDWEGNTDVIL